MCEKASKINDTTSTANKKRTNQSIITAEPERTAVCVRRKLARNKQKYTQLTAVESDGRSDAVHPPASQCDEHTQKSIIYGSIWLICQYFTHTLLPSLITRFCSYRMYAQRQKKQGRAILSATCNNETTAVFFVQGVSWSTPRQPTHPTPSRVRRKTLSLRFVCVAQLRGFALRTYVAQKRAKARKKTKKTGGTNHRPPTYKTTPSTRSESHRTPVHGT